MLAGCWGSRFVSADSALEDIYVGKSYYEVVADYGQPDGTMHDGMEGTMVAFDDVNIGGSAASEFYSLYEVRNRSTKEEGTPTGGMVFKFDPRMRCYAVESDFQIKKVKEPKPVAAAPVDRSKPVWSLPQMPRKIDFPRMKSKSPYAENVSIERIELTKEATTVHLMYKSRTPNHRPIIDSGICVMSEVYVKDLATGKHYAMVESDGITTYPEYTRFAHNEGGYDVLVYSLTFKPLPVEAEYIDIIEPGHSGRNFYRVDVRTRNTLTEQETKKH